MDERIPNKNQIIIAFLVPNHFCINPAAKFPVTSETVEANVLTKILPPTYLR